MSAKKLKQQHKNHKHIIKVNIMREEYDFSKSKKNLYAPKLKESIAIHSDKDSNEAYS